MIRQITGLQGGGKTYTAMRFIVVELVATSRWIVTNLTEIKLVELAQYMADTYPHLGIDVSKRIQLIPKQETVRWYRYRGAYTLPAFDFKNDGRGKPTELPEERDARMEAYFLEVSRHHEDKGCVYFLDEGHRHFRADSWQEFSHLGAFYLTQLRHLNDVFWVISQNSEQVTPAIRRLTFDTHCLRNFYLESFMFWKKPGGFAWAQYLGCPKWDNMASGQREPQDSGRVKLNLKLANCYFTRGALGGRSELAETKPVSKKLPLWTLWAAVAAVAVVLGFGFFQIPNLAHWLTHKVAGGFVGEGQTGPKTLSAVAPSSGPRANETQNPVSQPKSWDTKSQSVAPAKPAEAKNEGKSFSVDFWAVKQRQIRVGFSSGVVVTEADKLIAAIDASGVVLVDGRRIPYSRHASRPAAAVYKRSEVVSAPVSR